MNQLECLVTIINLTTLSHDEEKSIFESIINFCENVYDSNPMYAAEVFGIIYEFILNYNKENDFLLYDSFVWILTCTKSSILIRERYTNKIHTLIKKISKYVSDEMKLKIKSYLLSIEDEKERIDRICIIYQMYPINTFKEVIENNIDTMEFLDIFQMTMDKHISLSSNIICRALSDIASNYKNEVSGLYISNNTGNYIHLLNYCIIWHLIDLDFDIRVLEKYKDCSEFVSFVLNPESFDYSKVDFEDYMWQNLVYSKKYQHYFIEHKSEVINDKLKRAFELGIDNRDQQKIVYGILLNNDELSAF